MCCCCQHQIEQINKIATITRDHTPRTTQITWHTVPGVIVKAINHKRQHNNNTTIVAIAISWTHATRTVTTALPHNRCFTIMSILNNINAIEHSVLRCASRIAEGCRDGTFFINIVSIAILSLHCTSTRYCVRFHMCQACGACGVCVVWSVVWWLLIQTERNSFRVRCTVSKNGVEPQSRVPGTSGKHVCSWYGWNRLLLKLRVSRFTAITVSPVTRKTRLIHFASTRDG